MLDGTQVVASGILRGLGRTRPAAVANFAGYYLLALPLGWLWACVTASRWPACGGAWPRAWRWWPSGCWRGFCDPEPLPSFARQRDGASLDGPDRSSRLMLANNSGPNNSGPCTMPAWWRVSVSIRRTERNKMTRLAQRSLSLVLLSAPFLIVGCGGSSGKKIVLPDGSSAATDVLNAPKPMRALTLLPHTPGRACRRARCGGRQAPGRGRRWPGRHARCGCRQASGRGRRWPHRRARCGGGQAPVAGDAGPDVTPDAGCRQSFSEA